ncbi:unnamed protein product [Symbiodinium sp. CCMP2592]|nr:unnamed protein product [Symbiodinium sp. CCMP2592]
MQCDGQWGDFITLQALAQSYGRDIHCITETGDTNTIEVRSTHLGPPVVLVYYQDWSQLVRAELEQPRHCRNMQIDSAGACRKKPDVAPKLRQRCHDDAALLVQMELRESTKDEWNEATFGNTRGWSFEEALAANEAIWEAEKVDCQTRIDPLDELPYTWKQMRAWYQGTFSDRAIADYWHQCRRSN